MIKPYMSEHDKHIRKLNILITLAISYWIALVVAIIVGLITIFMTR